MLSTVMYSSDATSGNQVVGQMIVLAITAAGFVLLFLMATGRKAKLKLPKIGFKTTLVIGVPLVLILLWANHDPTLGRGTAFFFFVLGVVIMMCLPGIYKK